LCPSPAGKPLVSLVCGVAGIFQPGAAFLPRIAVSRNAPFFLFLRRLETPEGHESSIHAALRAGVVTGVVTL